MTTSAFTRREFLASGGAPLVVWSGQGAENDPLAAQFAEPPVETRPGTYWVWLNGFTDAARLTYELEELKKNGVSAAFILEIGTRSRDVPAGPAYMGPESVKALAHGIREAGRLGIAIGVTNASSWNAGGSWIGPEHASKGLYFSRTSVEGPARFSRALPLPEIPKAAPRRPDGSPAFLEPVAVVAVPESERLPGCDFLFDLAGARTVDRVVLHNGAARHGVRDFAVLVSDAGADAAAFREVLRATLEARGGAQTFRFAPSRASYVMLRILSGYDPGGRIELAEFEAFTTEGASATARGTQGGLIRYSAELGLEREWRATNIYDGRTSGGVGSWAVQSPLPPLVREPSGVIDLSGKVDADGRLTWDVPAGKWSILRFVTSNTGQALVLPSPHSAGPIIDHFSPEATRTHTEYMLERLHSQVPDFRGSALKYFYACSYEVRGSIWTPSLPAEFRRRRGYDMTPYLPVLAGVVVGSEDHSERFRADYRRTVAELFTEGFYQASREIVNRHGLKLVAEAGGPGWPVHQVPVDALKAQATLDIPRGEFWHEGRIWVVKETASAAHVYGKKVVQMEAFTSWRHWQDGPVDLKPTADRAFCEGANHFVWHTMPHTPPQCGKPGWAYHAGTHLGPNDPWWPMAKPFLDYLGRCSWMLQRGLFVADVCYYYGEQGWNFVPEKQIDPSLGFGFDYDFANSDVLLNRVTVRDGRLVLPDGMSYEVLALADRPDMDLEVLERIGRLVSEGATVVGRKPVRAAGLRDYPACDRKVKELADRLWGRCDGRLVRETSHGKGKIFWGVALREILARRGVGPDFAFTARRGNADLDYIHRRESGADIYFVRNRRPEVSEADCVFRAAGRAPELWDPVSGKIEPAGPHQPVKGGVRVSLSLPAYGSTFVVFRSEAGAGLRRAAQPAGDLEIAGPWEVSFTPGWGAPEKKVFPKLVSWSDDPDPGIRFYSGSAVYRVQFTLPAGMLGPGRRLHLDLGRVRVIARARLNGKPLGIAWTEPFRLEATEAAVAGRNLLDVEVANTWSNRLTGDAQSPGRKFTHTNLPWKPDTPLLAAGLLGPVRVLSEKA